MSQKNNKKTERKIGTQQTERKLLINPKYKNMIYTGMFLAVVLVFFVINNTQSEPNQGPYPPNYDPAQVQAQMGPTEAPNFSLPSATDGKTVKLSDFKGKVVIVDFWATWCPPCRAGIPDLVELKSEYKGKLEIIGISLDALTRGGKTKDDVVPFMKEYKINYPIVMGEKAVLDSYKGISSIPTSFVIDQKGNIVSQHIGLIEKSVYKDEVDKLLASK